MLKAGAIPDPVTMKIAFLISFLVGNNDVPFDPCLFAFQYFLQKSES